MPRFPPISRDIYARFIHPIEFKMFSLQIQIWTSHVSLAAIIMYHRTTIKVSKYSILFYGFFLLSNDFLPFTLMTTQISRVKITKVLVKGAVITIQYRHIHCFEF